MLKAEYSRKINKSSLILISDKDCEDEKDSIEMFRYQQIPYFLDMQEQKNDTKMQFCYDITGKRSLEQVLEYRSLDHLLFQKIITSFDQACIQAENYMLTENDILLKPEFVFAESDTEQMIYCYLPGNREDICAQFKGFMEYLLKYLNHKDEQAVQLAYHVYQQVVEERSSLHHVLGNAGKMPADQSYIDQIYRNIHVRQKEQPQEKTDMLDNFYARQKEQLQEKTDILNERELGEDINVLKERELHVSYTDQSEDAIAAAGKQQWHDGAGELERGRPYENVNVKENEMHQSDTVWNIREMQQLHENQNIEANMQLYTDQKKKETKQLHKNETRTDHEQICQDQESDHSKKKRKKKAVKKEKNQKNVQTCLPEIQKKETLRKKAAEKLKKMLLKNIYTDRAQYMEEETVFEADTEEELEIRNPTVCLMPETDGIRNQFVYQGADRARDFQCIGHKIILGSDREESDICIPLPMISRIHARVEIGEKGTFLEDMNSTNGTHVNGELLEYRERRLLQKGDIISLAGESYSFH